jgi:hypothetical protein
MKLKLKISPKNTKLGKIPSFSLSSLKTCPSKTEWCKKNCYAQKCERQYPNVKRAYAINLNATTKETFVSRMIEEVRNSNSNVMRIHVSGDFFDVRYIYNWIRIAKMCPDITFYGYTRAWEHKDLLPHLGILNAIPNVVLFASVDETTTRRPPKSFRVAYAGDEKANNIKAVMCPQQQDKVDYCSDCKICFNTKSKTNVFFTTH